MVTNGISVYHEHQKIVKILSGLIISNSTVNTKAQKFGTAHQKNLKNLTTPNFNVNIKLICSAVNRSLVLNLQKNVFFVSFLFCFLFFVT